MIENCDIFSKLGLKFVETSTTNLISLSRFYPITSIVGHAQNPSFSCYDIFHFAVQSRFKQAAVV